MNIPRMDREVVDRATMQGRIEETYTPSAEPSGLATAVVQQTELLDQQLAEIRASNEANEKLAKKNLGLNITVVVLTFLSLLASAASIVMTFLR